MTALSEEARSAAARVIACVDVLVKDGGGHGDPELWRVIAAAALQMEVLALGLDYTSCMNDKTLTPD